MDLTTEHPRAIALTSHTGDVLAAAFSPEGRWLATGSEDKTVRLWDLGEPPLKK